MFNRNFLPSQLGSYIFDTLPATVFAARCGRQHEDGLVKFGDGICTKSTTLPVAGSKGDSRKRSQRDDVYAHIDPAHGHDQCGPHGLRNVQ